MGGNFMDRVLNLKCVREIETIMKMTFPSPIDVIKSLGGFWAGLLMGAIIANISVEDGYGSFTRISKMES